MSSERDLTDRRLFPSWARDILRYGDTDRQGHVNNVAFATFCETGRVAMLYDWQNPMAPPGCSFVIARLILDFRGEIFWPGKVDIGTGVLSIGNSSFTLAQGVFVEERCVATSEAVIVLTDESTRRSTPLPQSVRDRLARLALTELTTVKES